MECNSAVSPQIVIVEYNSLFGNQRAVTIPYQPDFSREKAHFSNLYWGTSLPAFCRLASEKDYVYAGANSAGSKRVFCSQRLGGQHQRVVTFAKISSKVNLETRGMKTAILSFYLQQE